MFRNVNSKKIIFFAFSFILLSGLIVLILESGSFVIYKVVLDKVPSFDFAYKKHQSELGISRIPNWVKAHPFFGYVYTAQKGTNSSGFTSDYEYPYSKKTNDFVIGIFGGSVAHGLPIFSIEGDEVVKRLKNKVKNLKDKNIIFLNFAAGAMKQPQQFSIFSHYADTLDLSINLDGYNEISFNPPTLPVQYPNWYELLFGDKIEQAQGLIKLKRIRKFERSITLIPLQYSIFDKSNTYYVLWYFANKAINKYSYKISKQLLDGHSSDIDKLQMGNEENKMNEGVQNWGHFSRYQAILAKGLGKPAFFFIQPSPRVLNSKPYSDVELKQLASIKNLTQRQKLTTKAYKNLHIESEKIKKISPFVYDLSTIFANNPNTLYIDDCCHLNKQGYKILTDEMFRIIINSL